MRRRIRRSRRGVSLLEAVLAMLLMSFAVTVFGTAFPGVSTSMSRNRLTDMAGDACHQQLEFWRDIGYASLPTIASGSTKTSQSFTPPAAITRGTGSLTFTRVTETFVPTAQDTGLILAEATVTWNGSRNDNGSVTVTSLIVR